MIYAYIVTTTLILVGIGYLTAEPCYKLWLWYHEMRNRHGK